MTINIFCKASTEIGLGHLFRSMAFADQVLVSNPSLSLTFNLIGDESLLKIIDLPNLSVNHFFNEFQISNIQRSDIVFLDLTDLSDDVFLKIKNSTKAVASLSPVFNHFDKIEYYFGRTKYLNFNPDDYPDLKIYAGLEYAIIQKNCVKINSEVFENNLKQAYFPVAIIMGGGDASNKTLQLLKGLKKCKVPATFWVMMGEGYRHSLDELSSEIRSDTLHEIILAKTNKSMWQILKNCVLGIVPGGVTSYEAAYAGLPCINFSENLVQMQLIKELLQNNAAIDIGEFTNANIDRLSDKIEQLYANKQLLLSMHLASKSLMDGLGSLRILERIHHYGVEIA